MKETI